MENTAETLVLLTLHFSFMNVRYVPLNPNSITSIVWILLVVNLIVFCFIVISVIALLGRVPDAVHDREEVSAENEPQEPDDEVSSSSVLVDQDGPQTT